MAYLARLLGFGYPQTTDQAAPMPPPPLKQHLKPRLDRRTLSPTTRTKQWIIHTQDAGSESETPRTPSILRAKAGKVVKLKQITPSSTRKSGASPKRRGGSYWGLSWITGKNQDAKYEEDDEDDTLIEDEILVEDQTLIEDHTLTEDDSPPAHTPISNKVNKAARNTPFISDESDEDDYVGKLTKEEKKEHFLDVEDERIRRQEMLKQLERGDRTPEEIVLFEKLTMRGFKPIIPRIWMMDFKTLPETMFTSDESEIFINAASGNEFRGISHLHRIQSLQLQLTLKSPQPPKRSTPSSPLASAPATVSSAPSAPKTPYAAASNPTSNGPNATATSPAPAHRTSPCSQSGRPSPANPSPASFAESPTSCTSWAAGIGRSGFCGRASRAARRSHYARRHTTAKHAWRRRRRRRKSNK